MSLPVLRRPVARLGLLAGLLLFLGAAPAVAPPSDIVLPPAEVAWHALDTPGFSVVGDARPEQLREVARGMESLRLVLSRIGGSDPGDIQPIPVVVFGTAKSFDPYRRGFGSGAKNVAGFFTERGDRRMIALTTSLGDGSYGTIYHEYLHHVVQTKLGKVPVWFNEGIAGVYETFECTGKAAVVGRASHDKLRWLNAHTWHPLTELFRVVDSTRLHDQSDEITESFYVESWLLVHDVLFGHPERRPQLATFLEAYARGEGHDGAFERSFAGGIAGVEAEVQAYAHGTLPYVTLSFEELKISEPGETRTLDRAEVLDTLGELLLAAGVDELKAAEGHFRAALDAKPGDLRAQAGLGEAAFFGGRSDDAGPLLDSAVDAGLEDPVALEIAARLAYQRRRGDNAAATAGAPPPAVLRARTLARRALRSVPDDTDLLALYGLTFVNDPGDVALGVAALERLDRLEPDRPDVLHNLLLLHCQRRDRARAEAVLSRIEATGDAGAKADAREEVVELDLRDSDDAVKAREYDRAIASLKSARDRTSREDLKAKIADRIPRLEAAAAAAKKPARAAAPKH